MIHVPDLTVDELTDSLFWYNKGQQLVQYINLKDHKHHTLVLRNLGVVTIAIHGPHIYFADSDHISVANKLDGSNESIFRSNTCEHLQF